MRDGSDKPARGADSTPAPPPRQGPDTEQLAEQMSALLAELVRTPESEIPDLGLALRPGDQLGRLTLVRQIGRGGFGVVWEAEDPMLGRNVAVKALRPSSKARARGEAWFKREAEAVARVNHPNIVTLHDIGKGPTGLYLVFELLRGRPLDRRLEEGPLDFRSALAIGIEVARALVHAHRSGVVHRDLKPANVFVADDGAVKVLDFGLAHLLGGAGPGEGGTPGFMAPEQWRGESGDERTDLFAFGALLHAALSGQVPYPARTGTETRSAVLEPGPTPLLPPKAAPARFRRLVQRCLERDPKARPRSAAEVLEALKAMQRAVEGRWRQRGLAAAVAVAVTASAGAGWLYLRREAPPGERLPVVVADVDNQSGDPVLDGVTSLLLTALEPSRRVELLQRPRLDAVAREAKLPPVGRLDSRRGLELGKLAGARALLLPSARREGRSLLIELKAVDPADGRPLFTSAETASGQREIPAVIDRLAEATRRNLRERTADLEGGRLVLEQAVSPNLEAAHAYYQGTWCLTHFASGDGATSVQDRCGALFEKALSLDTSFALAHYRLATLLTLGKEPPPEARKHMATAVAALPRLAPREALLVQAYAAHLDGKDDEALRRYDELLARFPDDLEALAMAGELQFNRRAFGDAIPYLQKLVALDPEADDPLDSLVQALGFLDRRDDLRRLVSRLEGEPVSPARTRGIVAGRIALGEPDAAVAAARRAVSAEGAAWAQRALLHALIASGQYPEAEALARAEAEAVPDEVLRWWRLAMCISAQGRTREALALVDQRAPDLAAADATSSSHFWRAQLLAGAGDREGAWREAALSAARLPERRGALAVLLALTGDTAHAARLAEGLGPGSEREAYQALVDWRRGDGAGAAALLSALEQHDPWPSSGIPFPSFLLAEVSGASGNPRLAISAVARFRRLQPAGAWRAFAWPRAFLVAARAHAALGDRAGARAELDRFLTLWQRAEPGQPLWREATALKAALTGG